ncbi:hypothetical protein ET495_01670 [Xylanimonas allomyrinae]|uniref:Uncharacterized protein n=1 Tax=Xylanimonas allomyrinae TaxID=2509459 RepID=A0A4P6EIS6_9MICO|nr:hypothetical protein [Xylanimonas allomyrinae]QAY62195.1 hypothetical protein ET495_01670 [Xylanimonas allomyrinae]
MQRVSAMRRMPRSADPASPFAAAAPLSARPLPGRGIPLQQAVPPPTAPGAAPAGAPQPTQPALPPPPPPATPASYTPQGYPLSGAPAPGAYAPQATSTPPAAPAQYLPATSPEQYARPGEAPGTPAPRDARRRRRVSPGWIAFGVVAVVLVGAVTAVAWNLLSAPVQRLESDSPATAQPLETPSDAASEDAAAPVLDAFASPTGNISCEITQDAATCSIAQLNQQPAPVDTCDGTVGYRVTIDAAGKVTIPCVPAGRQPQPASADLRTLDYGQSVTRGQFTCTSEQSGMQCRDDTTGMGFSLARAGIGTY